MPYIKKLIASLPLTENAENKAFLVLKKNLNININEAQKLIDKKRIFCQNELVTQKNAILRGKVEMIIYEARPRGVEICFENDDFSVLEKPSGVLSHANGRHCEYSLSDEIWQLWGKNACVAHRLDRETSGLILIAKNKEAQICFKKMFEKREIEKKYLALVSGKTPMKFSVSLRMSLAKNYDDIKTRMQICESGKAAFSEFERLEYFERLNASLLKCSPKTGRQHQLRLHLFSTSHKILGEMLYGLEKRQIEDILDKKLSARERLELTGATRLLLHASELKFIYKDKEFHIKSNLDFIKECEKAMSAN